MTLGRARILIVEDELIIAEDIRMNLEEKGYEVLPTVSSPELAITKCCELEPDLVIMDAYLRKAGNGNMAGHSIRHELRIPVVYLTESPGDLCRAETIFQEPILFLQKPFSQKALRAIIEMALGIRGRNS